MKAYCKNENQCKRQQKSQLHTNLVHTSEAVFSKNIIKIIIVINFLRSPKITMRINQHLGAQLKSACLETQDTCSVFLDFFIQKIFPIFPIQVLWPHVPIQFWMISRIFSRKYVIRYNNNPVCFKEHLNKKEINKSSQQTLDNIINKSTCADSDSCGGTASDGSRLGLRRRTSYAYVPTQGVCEVWVLWYELGYGSRYLQMRTSVSLFCGVHGRHRGSPYVFRPKVE
ncbi:NAD-dependent malic enzyme [Striga asiatica]|uniref:NAD-dependent malic enzyme n=1 Tax=Striga asiatica TaxID=4170 RepID=A0A5A7Q0G8_STRAF|nr:NAD-dependent malic enzyme [Striga asiatica]